MRCATANGMGYQYVFVRMVALFVFVNNRLNGVFQVREDFNRTRETTLQTDNTDSEVLKTQGEKV